MLDRSRLPSPETFYRREFSRLSRPSRGRAMARCPFHRPDKRPSFSVNLREGNFLCHSCGVKGHDIVAFVRLKLDCDFPTACLHLGAWTNGTVDQLREIERQQKERERVERAAEYLASEQKRLRLELREQLHAFNQLESNASELLLGDPNDGLAWDLLSSIPMDRRRALAAYDLLSFGDAERRMRYAMNEESRALLVDEILASGFVRDDDGALHEVHL